MGLLLIGDLSIIDTEPLRGKRDMFVVLAAHCSALVESGNIGNDQMVFIAQPMRLVDLGNQEQPE